MNLLTAKMEKFAQLVFAGRNLTQAYREAYNTWGSARTAAVEASRIAKKPAVIRRIEELRLNATAPAVIEYFEKRMRFARIVNTARSTREILRAIRKDAILAGEIPRRHGKRTPHP